LGEPVVRQDDIRGEVAQGALEIGPALDALARAGRAPAAQLAENELRVVWGVFHQQNAEGLFGRSRTLP